MVRFTVLLLLVLSCILCVQSSPPIPHNEGHGSKRNVRQSARNVESITNPLPSNGTQRLLVLTVEYPNQKGQYSGLAWKNNYFSVWSAFYKSQSYNALQLDVDVVTLDASGNPVLNSNALTSYIPLSNNISKYANGQYGWKFQTQWSLYTIVESACAYIDSKNFDWTPYVQNNQVTNLIIMSAGYDYRFAQSSYPNTAQNDYLLSTSYTLPSAYGSPYITKSGAVAGTFTFCNEHTQFLTDTPTMAHIGQCVHEYGHGLGLPDLYDLSTQTTGVGYFDLMAYGLYADGKPDGSQPIGMGAWVKETLGWTTPKRINNSTVVTLGPSSQSSTNFLKVYPNSTSPIYYLIENRQNTTDTWDQNFVTQYGTGVLIWQINYANAKTYTQLNRVNSYPDETLDITNCPPYPAIVIAEATGFQSMSTIGIPLSYGSHADLWQAGDVFSIAPGTNISVIEFDANKSAIIEVLFAHDIDPGNTNYDESSSAHMLRSHYTSALLFITSILVYLNF